LLNYYRRGVTGVTERVQGETRCVERRGDGIYAPESCRRQGELEQVCKVWLQVMGG
jgi:hypothetical protein